MSIEARISCTIEREREVVVEGLLVATGGVGSGVSLPPHIERQSRLIAVEIVLKVPHSIDAKAEGNTFELVIGIEVLGHAESSFSRLRFLDFSPTSELNFMAVDLDILW